jgi:hypothetical protein
VNKTLQNAQERVAEADRIVAEAEAEKAALAEARQILAEDEARLQAEAREEALAAALAEYAELSVAFDAARDAGLDQLAGYAEQCRAAQELANGLAVVRSRCVALVGPNDPRLPEEPMSFLQQIYFERSRDGEGASRFRGMAI